MEAMLIKPKRHQVYEEMLMLKKINIRKQEERSNTCMNSNCTTPEKKRKLQQKI